MEITPEILKQVELNRWEKGIKHDPRSKEIMAALMDIDYNGYEDVMYWKQGGDGDNGEQLMYELDVYFELKDKGILN